MFILEKFSKLYNFSKELDDILTFISNTMQNKCPVNLSKLQEKNVTLSESMISMINAYNLSLEKELTSEGANIYAKKTKEERDKLREEFIKIQTELAAAISVNEKLVQENKKLPFDLEVYYIMKRTYQPNNRKKAKKHGFFARIKGNVLKSRRNKKRKKLCA